MTWQRICQISFELLVCAVHPIPGKPKFFWAMDDISDVAGSKWVPNDVAFSLPMFLRLYLIGRVMLLHRFIIHLSSNYVADPGRKTRQQFDERHSTKQRGEFDYYFVLPANMIIFILIVINNIR